MSEHAYVMSDRLRTVLELVRQGVSRKPELAARTGQTLRTMKELLTCLVECGYVVSVKTDPHNWSWVPIEALDATKAAAAERARESRRLGWQRSAVRRRAGRPVVLPRGHGEEVHQAVVPVGASRPIKQTAAASVWELGSPVSRSEGRP